MPAYIHPHAEIRELREAWRRSHDEYRAHPFAPCDSRDELSGAACLLTPDNHGPRHQGWAHFPGQLATWPVEES